MPYKINWNKNSVHIIYTGEINNDEIKSAHYEVNNDERFFDCHNLILDITKCGMQDVEVSNLFEVIGLDLGNLKMRDRHKITMLATTPENKIKAEYYINILKKHSSKIRLFNTIEESASWLNSIP